MEDMLRVDWSDPDIGVDLLPKSWLDFDGVFPGRRHEIFVPRTQKYYPCICDVTVSGRHADFDYRARRWRKFNDRTSIDIGVMRIEFADRHRKMGAPIKVAWKADAAGSRFVPYPEVVVSSGPQIDAGDPDFQAAADEGNQRMVRHLARERVPALVLQKKKAAQRRNSGRLACEICGLDFKEAYGEAGIDFCEVHHRSALGSKAGRRRTELKDLAILCSNCHRMIHRTDPILDVEAFKRTKLRGVRAAWRDLLQR